MRFLFAILLLTVQARASLILDSCSRNHPIITVVTDASTTPTVSKVPVCAGWNGLRIWTGEQPVAEPFCDVYVSINGAAPYTLRTFRWSGRIISATSGDTISLGTVDGRTLAMTPMYTPMTLESLSAVTNTANCDLAGPPIWSPSKPHVILPANVRAFRINCDGTERDVFLSEYDGTSWTPTRWLKLETNRNVSVRTSYRKIALANYAGATLSISGPLGTVIGGVSTPMTLPIPVATGTTWSCGTVADLTNSIAHAVAGDEIVLDDGTYAMPYNVLLSHFVANNAALNYGLSGITLRSASGNRAACVISMADSTHGTWNIDYSPYVITKPSCIKDLTFDFTGSAMPGAHSDHYLWYPHDGKWIWQNVRITGVDANGGDLFYPVGSGSLTLDMLNCQIDTSAADLYAGSGSATEKVRYINCVGYDPGPTVIDQCLTSHSAMPVEVYGGFYSNAVANVIAGGSDSDPIHCFFVTTDAGVRAANGIQTATLFACNIKKPISAAPILTASGYAAFTHIQSYMYGGSNILHCRIPSSGYGMYVRTEAQSWYGNMILSNIFGMYLKFTTAGTLVKVIGNTIATNSTTGLDLETTNLPADIRNNAVRQSTWGGQESSGSPPAGMVIDYNTVDDSINAGFISLCGAHNTLHADAQLDSNMIPTPGGNCDGNGDPTAVLWVGDSDPFGLVWIYSTTRVSRGAREIPAYYSGAQLYPDLW